MEIKKTFTTGSGATVNISVNCKLPKITEDEKNQLLRRFGEYSREIYLEIAAEINKINKTPSVSALSMFISGLNDTERTGKSAIELLNDMGLTEVRLSNAVLSLATSDGILTKATDVANTAWEENTALAVEAGKRYETTESQIQMAKNSMTNAGIALGEVLTPYVADAARGINEFAQNVAGWVKENPETVKQILEFAGALGRTILTFKTIKLAGTGIQTAVTGIKKLSAEVEYYGQSLREDGILTSEETANLKQPFEDLINYLEQDFSASFNLVFQNFQTSAVGVMEELGGDIAEVDGLLQAFKNKYSENVSNANQNIQNYLDKAIAGTATEEDRQQFEQSQAMLYALAEADSQSKKDFDAAVAALDGIDFGADQEAAVAKIQEMTEYAKSYLEEINNAQKAVQEENESLQRKNEIQHEYGLLSDEEYENGKNALAVASVASSTAYQKSFDSFMEQYKGVLDQLQGQLDENILKAYSKSMNSGNFLADFGESAKAVWGVVISGYTKTWDEEYRNQHMDAVRETMSGIIDAVDEMSKAAEVSPIIIPVETAQTAVSSGLINSATIKDESGKTKIYGHLSLKPEEVKVIPSAAYAGGTDYSADTFLAGENGAEIITNARGYKVYTAEETKDIFDTYTQIVSILPTLQRVNAATVVKTPELSSQSGESAPVNVTITIEQNINGGNSEEISRSNEDLVYKIREIMEEINRDNRRRAFN